MSATTGGVPLGNVAITGDPGGLTATTAADGTFSLKNVPVGAYTLTFKRAGFADKVISGVSVATAGPTNMAVSMDTNAATDGPSIVLSSNFVAGFNQPVTLTAQVTASSDEDAAALTYKWAQTGGAAATFTGGGTNAIQFTTLKISDAKPGLVGRFGALGFNPDQTGNYSFSLTVTDPQGHSATASATVRATWQAPGLANVAVGLPAWFVADSNNAAGARTAWSWTLDTSGATGSTAQLIDPATNQACANPCTSQYVMFKPDLSGHYVLTETDATTTPPTVKTLDVYGGMWVGVMDAPNGNQTQCLGCHAAGGLAPDKFTPWKNTAHYSALQRKLDGLASSHFGPSCMECHTVGDSPIAQNGGWDDVAQQVSWSFPAKLQSGNWSSLETNQPTLAQLGSIQCENCHGPQNSSAHPFQKDARISFSADVCASCHQEAPNHYFPGMWATSMHADATQTQATVEGRANNPGGGADILSGAQHCARCHSGQGFAQYAKMLGNYAVGRWDFITTDNQKLGASNAPTVSFLQGLGLTLAEVQPQTCQACHDPHANPQPSSTIDCSLQQNYSDGACAQLRVYDSLPNGLPNGQGPIAGVGTGAICMACHNSRNGEHTDYGPTDPTKGGPPYAETPHDGTVTDVYFGFNAYFVPRYSPSPHMAVADTCAGCHVANVTASESAAHQTSNHAFATDLTVCANCHGSNGVDGNALLLQVQSEVPALDTLITTHVTNVIYAQTSPITVQASRISCTVGGVKLNCASSQPPETVPPTVPPSNIAMPFVLTKNNSTITRSGTTLTITLTGNPAPTVSVPYYSPLVPSSYPASPVGTTSLSKFTVSLNSVAVNGAPLFPASSITAKSIWNITLFKNDPAAAVHNLPFANAVIGATNAQLNNNALTP